MMAPDPLDNNRNWVRAAMGLKYLKEGLESFVVNEIINLQTTFLQDIRTTHGLPPTATCNQCTFKQNLSAKCPNKLCDKIVVKIVDQHRFTQRNPNGLAKNYNAPCWKNTDATKWGSSPWEIAKCFMANGYSDKISAKETDCTGILSVLINCLSLQNTLTTHINPPNDILSKMRETRNKIMHSSNLEVTDVELQQHIDDMIDILNDSKTIQAQPDAVAARNKLNQLKTTFVISSRDELKLRKEAIEAFEQKQKELLEQCQQQQDDLQSKLYRALASITQAEGASKQQQADLQSKVDQATNTLSQNHAICLQFQKDLQSKYDQTVTSLAQAKGDIQSSQGQINSLETQMTKVFEVLKKYQLAIDQKVTDKHQKHVQILENRLLLQTRLREKYKYMSTIPLSPIMKKMKVDINKVYQKLMIRPDLIHDPKFNGHDEHRFLRIENKTAIDGYREIFFNKGEPCKNIFVVGNGGVGKTTWCLKLLSSWVNGETNDKDKDVLQRFKYVFYVQLRHTKQASQINDMIKSYLFSDEQDLMNIVNDVLVNEPEHCLVLLDGLDEWKLPSEQRINDIGLPHDPMHSKYTTLITSRPWKLKILRLEPTAIDKAVEIKGLDEYGISLLAGHIIDQLNCVHKRNKELKMFNECISKRKMPMIEVPLMLSIFVYLWYENDFIGETFAGLYSKLTVNLFKTAEGDKKRIRQNLEVSKLENIKDIIEKRKEKTSEITMPIPDCLKDLGKSFIPLLYSLGKLSFNGLVSKNIESFLVFNQESIEEYMSEEELEVALYIGILSQSQTIGDSTGERFSMSFMHKTIQEFLAAVYMVSASEHDETIIKSKFTNYCKEIENVFEIENILIFICGMDPKLAGELTRQISIMHNKNTIVHEHYQFSDYEKLHETLMRCVREEHLYLVDSNRVYIVNHFIRIHTYSFERGNRNKVNTETLSYIHTNQNRIPMCLDINLYSEDKKDEYKYEDAICRGLSGVHTLEKLVIYKRIMSLYNDKGCLRISECINHLHFQTLELEEITGNLGHIDLSNNTELTDLSLKYIQLEELSLPKNNCLQSIKLECIKHPQGDEEIIKLDMKSQLYLKWLKHLRHPQGGQESIKFKMKNYPGLKLLTLDDIAGDVGHINLSNNSQLTHLTLTSLQIEEILLPQNGCLVDVCLIDINHPHGDQGRLTLNINNQPCLAHLMLVKITGNVGHINLSNNSKLTDLAMTILQIEEISLPQNGCLVRVRLYNINHPHGDQGRLTLNINKQPYLTNMTLEVITGSVGYINLSNNSKLKNFNLRSSQIEEISLPQNEFLQSVRLKYITHPNGDQGSLIHNLINLPHLKHLTLEDIPANVGHINLSNNSKLIELTLTSLQIEELTLPHNGCLHRIFFKSMKHQQGDKGSLTLNMKNQLCLKRLTLDDITINICHINLSNSLELTDLEMTSLQIDKLSLPQDGRLQRVWFESIQHTQGDQGSLTLNINNQSCLKHLTLKNITGNVGHINLSNNSKLKSLTMTSLQTEELSLPHNGCLETLELKSLNHPDGDQGRLTLNINNQPQLEQLTLDNIIGNVGHIDLSINSKLKYLSLPPLQIEELSLPHNGCLETLELKSLNHPDGDQGRLTLNINNQHQLEQLTLDNIIGNVGHIDLSNNSQLEHLIIETLQIEEISLPQNGSLKRIELKYIKHIHGDQGRLRLNMNNQPCLNVLRLEDAIGNVGHIDLYNNSKLEYLYMTFLQIEAISLPQDGCLQTFYLKSMKHPQGDQGRLTLSIDNQPFLNYLKIEDITGNIGHIDLSNNSQLEHLIMESLQIEEISLPQDGCLQTVWLQSIKHLQGDQGNLIPNMINLPHLKNLNLDDIAGNIDHIDLSNNSHLMYLTMTSIHIEDISLPQDGCLEIINLKSMKHSRGDQGRLKINIKHQPHLDTFTLEDISCNIGHIDLSKNTKLKDVSVISVPLVNITVPPGVVIKS